MAYSIVFKKSVGRDLKKIDRLNAEKILEQITLSLAESPEEFPLLKGRFAGLRKLRAGDYRVIFTVLENSVLILRISHRKEAYR